MKMVTLECRDCGTSPHFATEKDTDDIETMQEHMDINFLARCGKCFACNWEVVGIGSAKPKRPVIAASNAAL